MRSVLVSMTLLLSLCASAQHPSEPVLKSSEMPKYPPLARQARIQGEVKIEFVLNQDGVPITVNLVSGHPMLAPTAVENVRAWRFEVPADQATTERRYETTFEFKLDSGEADPADSGKLTVVTHSFHRVEVITQSPTLADIQISGCPTADETKSPVSRSNQDFVEMSRSGCYGTCPVYTLRVTATGEVLWDGAAYVSAKGKRRATIATEQARVLINKFSSPEFWRLCTSYSRSVTDSATTGFFVNIGGRNKKVSNYANSAPKWVESLEEAVDSAVPIHLWQHGDPQTEPLSRIADEGYLPKPGVTALMRAAIRNNVNQMQLLIEQGSNLFESDSSGWTALMYAAASGHSEPVQMLLGAGANPNQASPHGDTALMASAFRRTIDEDLLRAGANINAQNHDGVTVLMILAGKGETDEVDAALKAGADPSLKDTQGRTALDYLRLGDCGKSPIRDEVLTWMSSEGCGQLDEDDFRKGIQLLTPAVQR